MIFGSRSGFRLNQKEAQKLVSMTTRCPVDCTFNLIGKKFTIHILRNMIILGHTRFNQFETIEGINPKTLAVRLKEMLENDLIERKVHAVIPVRVEYFVTEKGKSVLPILEQMLAFSMKYASKEVFADGKPRSFKDVLGRHTEHMP
ncbi:MAG TPA: helix-turn-helix domain-containing protein [Nitrososphaeraceae archaeon]